ncbi:ABC transporter ATP-binding protein [Arcobacter sp. FWKO B]|uniref:ATP-binding cassette domain-containing protein n=1 Tax=Arcobacter sp. FWKO B TaxID=2593672 RepID=UPI0018A6038E|nr:ABC transporter ATP-binding protein [Arcobacter sp. FWKO B]QOG12471.1 ABC transporter ATP-binding protein [Arcobacter sp. FWKO B]
MKLEVNNLSTTFLKDISFEIMDENIVILGSNGAGKTTLAKAIVNLEENDNIYFDNIQVSKMSAKQRAVALNFVPSKLEVYDEYIDVEEFLELSILNGSTKEDIDKLLQTLDLTYLKNNSTKFISSGESQMVLFIGGLLQNSKLTIYDEPTANLDNDKKIKIYQMLKSSYGFKIVITHDLNLAYRLGFRIIYLQNGKKVFDGKSKDFFKDENLQSIFGDCIKRVDEFFMVNFQ